MIILVLIVCEVLGDYFGGLNFILYLLINMYLLFVGGWVYMFIYYVGIVVRVL